MMTAFDALMLFWALPSLVVLLVLIRVNCWLDGTQLDSLNKQDWMAYFFESLFYPWGVFDLIVVSILHAAESGILTKPISEIWKK